MLSNKHFLDCPEEINEYILLGIESEADLFHLALTCKALSSRIIPYRIQFRTLRINLQQRTPCRLIRLLNKHPTLRSRFRHAEIRYARESKSRLPLFTAIPRTYHMECCPGLL
ncbi:hypothetical protein M422DRAFT_149642 [Sphaerobolus stellatus SS14]|nr:hypothetical protein M422DRAFT_149642 [Sphaerobolus stellatus SS14]